MLDAMEAQKIGENLKYVFWQVIFWEIFFFPWRQKNNFEALKIVRLHKIED